ncbi:MAG: hypothetical protein RIM80_21040 [Alphaproteobacteria bacterium]
MTNPSGSKDIAILKHRTLQMRLILLAATISALAALSVGLFDYQRIVAQSHETARAKMNAEEAILKGRLQDAYAELGSDALTFARSAAVVGLAAATMGERIAARDPSQSAWKRQIENNAAAFLRAHPHYAQIRLIRADDAGREVVRVDQNSAGIAVMPTERLRNKAGQPYFQRGIAAPPDSVVFSNVELNVDFEVVDYKFATMRAMTPIYHNDSLFSLVVINVNYTILIKKLLAESQFRGEIYIGAGSDSYFVRSANGELEYYSPDMMPGAAPAAASLIDDGRATAQMVRRDRRPPRRASRFRHSRHGDAGRQNGAARAGRVGRRVRRPAVGDPRADDLDGPRGRRGGRHDRRVRRKPHHHAAAQADRRHPHL